MGETPSLRPIIYFDETCSEWSPRGGPEYEYEKNCQNCSLGECQDHSFMFLQLKINKIVTN